MYRPSGKSELQTDFEESVRKSPANQSQEWLAALASAGRTPSRLKAAVVLLLREGPSGFEFLLTLRSEDLKDHPGEYCFPGGVFEERSDAGLRDTVLRELSEEVGIDPLAVELWSPFDRVMSRSGIPVTPFVAFLTAPNHPVTLQTAEVSAADWYPLASIFDPKAWHRRLIARESAEREIIETDIWEASRPPTWGLTAYLLRKFRDRLQSPAQHVAAMRH